MMISMNGQLIGEQDAVVSVYDHGFLYGIGLFETFRTYNGVPFLLAEHMQRLENGCVVLGIEFKPNIDEIGDEVARLLAVNNYSDAYVRYSVSAGAEGLGLSNKRYEKPQVVIYTKPLPLYHPLLYEQGRDIQILAQVRSMPDTAIRLKSFHYMNGWLAKQELLTYPWAANAEGVQVNERDEVTEGIVSNLFFVRDRQLYTPSVSTGALPGITREFVMQLAKQIAIGVEEGQYSVQALFEADEVFLTNSIQEIVPVARVYKQDGGCRELAQAGARPITSALMQQYRQVTAELTRKGS